MLTTYNEIKSELLNEYEHATEDTCHEIADSNTPIYYSDIIKEWTELESEFCDTWQDYPITQMTSITQLMTIDLYNYYYQLAWRAWEEIKEEQEEDQN